MAFINVLRKFLPSYLTVRCIPSRGTTCQRYFSSGTRQNYEPIDVSEKGWYWCMMEHDLDMDIEELASDFNNVKGPSVDTFLSKDAAEFTYCQREGYFCAPWTIPSQGYITVTTDASTIGKKKDGISVFANIFRSSEGFLRAYIGILRTAKSSEAKIYGNSYAVFENARARNDLVNIETDFEQACIILSNAKNSGPVTRKNIECGGELTLDDYFNLRNNVQSFKDFNSRKVERLHVYPAHTLATIGCKLLPSILETKPLSGTILTLDEVEKLVRKEKKNSKIHDLWFSFMHSVEKEYYENVFTLVCH